MADFAIPTIDLAANQSTTDGAIGLGTAIDATKTAVITPSGPLEEMIIRVANTEASTNVVTVLAGASPPADAMGQGDLVTDAIGATTGFRFIGPLTSARFLQANGTIRLTFEAGMTGFVLPLQLSRKA